MDGGSWGAAFYAYSTNYLIDVAAGIIVDVEASPARRTNEVNASWTMVERVEDRFDLKPARLIGDTAYGSAEMLGWMVDGKSIEPRVPVWDKSERSDDTLFRSDCTWSEEDSEYRCPAGKPLRCDWRKFTAPRSGITSDDTIIYRSSVHDCKLCPMKAQCCPNTPTDVVLVGPARGALLCRVPS